MARLDPAKRVRCPCCGYPTLAERAAYEVCELCSWEDDGQDDPHADEVRGGPNHGYSLTQARDNFRRFLVMYEPEADRRIGGPDGAAALATKRRLMAAFDRLKAAPAAERSAVLVEIDEQERRLHQHLKDRIREHEAAVLRARKAER
jgi:hypothetical protein